MLSLSTVPLPVSQLKWSEVEPLGMRDTEGELFVAQLSSGTRGCSGPCALEYCSLLADPVVVWLRRHTSTNEARG